MGHDTKYQSDFYNYFNKLVSVKIAKEDYSGAVINVRTSEVTITNNYQDDNTPIIGKGCKIVIIADSTDMAYLEDLLLSYERQFLCTIEYDGVIAFRGYSLCDLNERQLLPYAQVTVEFTDYMHRLTGDYHDCLADLSQNTDVFTMVAEFLNWTKLDLPIYVNSTLFETNMNNAATDTFLPQIRVQNANYYENSYTRDNLYDAINKSLQPFSAFIYSHEDKWIIERQEDITRTDNWVMYDETGAASVATLRKSINKQDGDFEYVDASQIVAYNSGLHTLTLRLQDKLLESLIFNNYTAYMGTPASYDTEGFPNETTNLDYRTWYINEALGTATTGENWMGNINTYFRFQTVTDHHKGVYYNFNVQFNAMLESSGGTKDTTLNIAYKASSEVVGGAPDYFKDVYSIRIRFLLRLIGGTYSNYWLQIAQSVGQGVILYLYPPAPDGDYKSADPGTWCFNSQLTDVSDHENYDWSIYKQFNLTDTQVVVYNTSGTGYVVHTSLWETLGYPTYQEFDMMFLPTWYSNDPDDISVPTFLLRDNVFGDVEVTVSVEDIDNNIEYYLNEDFVKTDEIDLYLFDLDNINYANGMLEADGLTLTTLWTSENSPVDIPLYEVFAKVKFRKYGRTVHQLKGSILIDDILKPFTMISDDTLLNESDEIMTFLLNGFTWNLNTGIYDIEAEEYTEDEVIVAGITYDSAGDPEVPGYTLPTAPTGGTGSQFAPGDYIHISWDPITDAIGYIVQRKPQYYGSAWLNEYKTVRYIGASIEFDDEIQDEGPMVDSTQVVYRVAAYNSKGTGPWSAEWMIYWYEA